MTASAGPLNFIPPDVPRGHGLPVAPLVDIVFLLICFFTFTSQLIQTQKDPAVELPVMVSPDAQREVPAEVTVNLRPDGTVTVGGRRLVPEALGPVLAAHVRQARAAGLAARVVVRADQRRPFAELDTVLGACRAAGLGPVIFRARAKE